MMTPRTLWRDMHLGNRMLDLGVGCYSRKTGQFRRYNSIRPNVVLVGSQKCGTSSLAHYLSMHPDIHVSSPMKEPGYYIFDEWAQEYWHDRGINYRSREALMRRGMLTGYGGQRYLVDATTRYTLGTSQEDFGIAHKLKQAGVEKILYIVRNPFERVISAYNHIFKGRPDPSEFEDYLNRDTHMADTSCYFRQITPYIETLGRENTMLIVFEDFVAHPEQAMRDVYTFLDLPEHCPETGYQKIGATHNKVDYFFNSASYEKLLRIVQPDADQFQTLISSNVTWDLSRERWVN